MPPSEEDRQCSDDSTHNHTTIETRSLTDSIREHIVEGGFRYHAYHAGKYPFPNDSVEQQCDEMRHVLTLALSEGQAFYAPIDAMLLEGAEVLDIGEDLPVSFFAFPPGLSIVGWWGGIGQGYVGECCYGEGECVLRGRRCERVKMAVVGRCEWRLMLLTQGRELALGARIVSRLSPDVSPSNA